MRVRAVLAPAMILTAGLCLTAAAAGCTSAPRSRPPAAHPVSATPGHSAARPTAIACREHLQEHELEAIFVEEPVATGRVLAIGETNAASGPMGAGQLRRLDHLRGLLPDDRVGQPPRVLLFSRSGFAADLAAEAAARTDVELVDLERLYRGR